MGMEERDVGSRSFRDLLIMILCVFVMVLLLLMASSSFTPELHEVYRAIRKGEALVMSGVGILQGYFL
jgi:hypothetical protein